MVLFCGCMYVILKCCEENKYSNIWKRYVPQFSAVKLMAHV